MPFRAASSSLPLTATAFEVLLALSESDLHGYAILQAVGERLGGLAPLRTGTLYRALARLVTDGLIVEVRQPPHADRDDRRRYYHLTDRGREVAQAEAARLADQVAAARKRKLLPDADRG